MSRRRSRWRWITSAALIATGVIGLVGLLRLGNQPEGTDVRNPSPSPSSIPRITAGNLSPVAIDLPEITVIDIPMCAPSHLSIPSIGLEADIDEYTEAMLVDGAVDPSSFDRVAWYSPLGTPGTDATNTVYFYGHTWNNPAVFNNIKLLQPGDEAFVTTCNGTLRYVVELQYTVPKPQLSSDYRFVQNVKGRLNLVGCWRETGHESTTTDNIVVQFVFSPEGSEESG